MTNKCMPKFSSITHLHILSVVNTIVENDPSLQLKRSISILDAGCGNGRLIEYLYLSLSNLHPRINFVIYGFDVVDHGVQSRGFIDGTIDSLNKALPIVDWESRIFALKKDESWNFVRDQFDVVISNQVLEHVSNKKAFFGNIYECLNTGGYSINLAPLKEIIHEGHIFLPFAHRIRSYSALLGYIGLMSRLGMGKFKGQRKAVGCSLHEYSVRHADYIYFWTSYSTEAETLDIVRDSGLRGDFRFSVEFFLAKFRQLFGLKPKYGYYYREGGFIDSIFVKVLKYLSSTTLVCKKQNTY